jgi:hypothetical protein
MHDKLGSNSLDKELKGRDKREDYDWEEQKV